MPTYKCTRFNRSANVPSRMCECGKRAIPISKNSHWLCPEHGNKRPIKLCDCDGCQKSYAVLQRSNLRTRPWNTKGHSIDNPNRWLYLLSKRRRNLMRDIDGFPHHRCPKCETVQTCSEPLLTKLNCGENFPSKNPYVICPINISIENGTGEFRNVIRRACGGFWPSNPITKDEELQEHIFYFHDANRQSFLMKEVNTEIPLSKHKCAFIRHMCSKCHYIWESAIQDRFLATWPMYKDEFYLGTATLAPKFKNHRNRLRTHNIGEHKQ